MTNVCNKFYINGEWIEPGGCETLDVINPATEEAFATISLGTAEDVDVAVKAAIAAFDSWSQSTVEERLAILGKIVAGIEARTDDLASTISQEMGAPIGFAKTAQVGAGIGHFVTISQVLQHYEFEQTEAKNRIVKEPVGVCGFITPWNWPLNQIACKVAPALAAGCTMVLKPSEVAPLDAYILTEIFAAAGVPAGVFNMLNGDGATVGAAISAHPGFDMVSFTGSTRAGRAVAQAAAQSVKRVTQELGGKSANIILPDADLQKAVSSGVISCFSNSGQSCNAPTRMLVPRDRHDEALEIAKATAAGVKAGDPNAADTNIGPVVSEVQFNKIQGLIEKGIAEGAELVIGGPGRPDGLNVGYYVKPTVFGDVHNDMTIAREEIFGPVLSILPYGSEEEAITIANDTDYGLSGYVQSDNLEHARKVARRLRTGNVHLNGAPTDFTMPFGGYKQSGNGREWGIHGFEEFLETKAIMGYGE